MFKLFKSIWAAIKKVFGIISWIKGLFKSSHPPPIPSGAVVVKVEIEDGYKKVYWSDGRIERIKYDENDPTDVGGFINHLSK